MKVYECIAAACEAEGAGTVFGLMGDANMELLSAMSARDGLRVVHARHENAAVAMADGYARASGGIGTCSITCGPGLTQVGTSLVAASRHGSPIVLLAGDTPAESEFHLQEFDPAPFAAATESAFVRLRRPDTVAEDVRRAFLTARTERRPVVLSTPMDVLVETYPWDWDYQPSTELVPAVAPVVPVDGAVQDLADQLAGAERPVILAGAGAVAAGARAALVRIAEQTGALLATSLRAKGLFEGEAFDAGVAGAFSTPSARAQFAEADLVVGVGASMGYFTTEGGYLFPSASLVQVDVQPTAWFQGQRVAHQHVQGDALLVAERLAALLADRPPATGYRRPEVAAALAAAPPTPASRADDLGLDPAEVVAALSAAVPTDWLVVVGAGHFWNFVVNGFGDRPPESYLYTYDFGVIGQAVPLAIGVALARPGTKVLVIEGDGSLIMNAQELETIGRHGIGLLAVVMNDGAYGAEIHKLRAKGLDPEEVRFGHTDLAAVARAFGVDAEEVRSLDLLAKLVDGFDGSRPQLLDVRLTSEVMAPQYARLYFGRED